MAIALNCGASARFQLRSGTRARAEIRARATLLRLKKSTFRSLRQVSSCEIVLTGNKMQHLRRIVLGSIALGLFIVALANRGDVSLTLMPLALEDLIGFNLKFQVPLFVVIFLGVIAGLLIGFVWEWLREMKHRTASRNERRHVVRLEREVSKLKSGTVTEQDDVLALLEKVS